MKHTISNVFGHSPEIRTFQKCPEQLVDDSVLVGIEIEVENCRQAPVLKYWKVINDGSLRNHGREFITPPILGKDIINALDELTSDNLFEKTKVNERCGLHIHVDCRDLDYDSLVKWLVLYSIFERVLYKYCGEERTNSNFCVPLYRGSFCIENLSRLSHDPVIPIDNWQKYFGVNILPIITKGSVEFRMHPPTKSKDEILRWINILLSLRQYAVHKMPDNILNNVSALGGEEFLVEVFGNTLSKHLSYPSINEDILEGSRTAQEILYQDKFYKESGSYERVSLKESIAYKNLPKLYEDSAEVEEIPEAQEPPVVEADDGFANFLRKRRRAVVEDEEVAPRAADLGLPLVEQHDMILREATAEDRAFHPNKVKWSPRRKTWLRVR